MLAAADKRPDFASVFFAANGQKTAKCRQTSATFCVCECSLTFSAHFVRIHLLNWYVISVRPFICHSRPVIPSALRTSPRPLTLILRVWVMSYASQWPPAVPTFSSGGVVGVVCCKCCASSCWASKFKDSAHNWAWSPVTCQSELLHVGHINLNNEKSPRGWGGAGKWNNNCEGEICLWISQAFFGPWVLLRLLVILFFLGKNKAYLTQDSICKYLIKGWSSSICIFLSYFLLNTS